MKARKKSQVESQEGRWDVIDISSYLVANATSAGSLNVQQYISWNQ